MHRDFHPLPEPLPPLPALLGVTNWPLIPPFPAGFLWAVDPGQQFRLGSCVSQPWRQQLSGGRKTISRNGLRFQILLVKAPWVWDAAEKMAGRVNRGRGWRVDEGVGCEGERQGRCCEVLPAPQGPAFNVVLCLKWFRRQTLKPS